MAWTARDENAARAVKFAALAIGALVACLLLALVWLFVTTPTAQPIVSAAPIGPTEQARVVEVIDGDTIVVDRGEGAETVRYIGIDTPEREDPPELYEAADRANRALVEGRTVVLERDVSEVDRFGRLLRYVWLDEPDGWVMVNLELVRSGVAEIVVFRPDVRHLDLFRDAERGP